MSTIWWPTSLFIVYSSTLVTIQNSRLQTACFFYAFSLYYHQIKKNFRKGGENRRILKQKLIFCHIGGSGGEKRK